MRRAVRARFIRRLFMVVLSVFLLAGLLGFLGVRTGTTSAEGGGYQLEAAREQGIRDLDEVEVAILDPDGKFAFIKMDGEQHQPEEKPSI